MDTESLPNTSTSAHSSSAQTAFMATVAVLFGRNGQTIRPTSVNLVGPTFHHLLIQACTGLPMIREAPRALRPQLIQVPLHVDLSRYGLCSLKKPTATLLRTNHLRPTNPNVRVPVQVALR